MYGSGSCTSESYDVFLSFRGPDTRHSFADFLYDRLIDAGIVVFRDEEELPVGEPITPKLVQAIKNSKISIPVFSKDYASSKSCLMEVAQMVECRKTTGHMILPVFYDVEPSVLKNQIGTFGESLEEHRGSGIDSESLEEWKEALHGTGHLKGWNLANIGNGYQSKAVSLIVSYVRTILKKDELVLPENLVKLDRHVGEIMRKLDIASQDVRTVGIHGIGGVGKSTLAKLVYNQVYHQFHACSFIENVREVASERGGPRRLQNQLVSNLLKKKCKFDSLDAGLRFMRHRFRDIKVLILLDDVDARDQLAFLRKPNQFGPGSRVIITTRRGDILQEFEKYEVQCMNDAEALRLFCKHAFGRDLPEVDYYHLSKKVVSILGGLPLALEVTGSCLFERGKKFWEDTVKKLELKPNPEVHDKLMISYEYLDEQQKEIFLDIACFFIGKDHRTAFYMWEYCQFLPSRGIETLILLSLVKIGENGQLQMHDQLRDLGREIVREQNPKRPGKRSRLWKHEDAISTLHNREGTPEVEGLSLIFDSKPDESFSCENFKSLTNLRFLGLDQANIEGDFKNHHLSSLRWLDWEGCSRISDLLNLHSDDLVILNLSCSQIAMDVNSWILMMKTLKKLKVLDLGGCANLSGCLQFPDPLPLKVLNLENCSRLRLIDPSISKLNDLESLSLRLCTEVVKLPGELGYMRCLKELLIDETSIRQIHFPEGSLEQLKTLSARGCRRLYHITDSIGSLKSLTHLAVDDAIIEKLPRSIGSLSKLESLSLKTCKNLLELPDSVGDLKSLISIDLSYTSIDELPTTFRNLDNLKVLKMERCFLREFPDVIAGLGKLEEVNFSSCRRMNGKISRDFSTALRTLRLSHTDICSLPTMTGTLSHLQDLDLVGCRKLPALPDLPSSLVSLRAGSKELKVIPDLAHLAYLKELHLHLNGKGDAFEHPPNFQWISSLLKLEVLELSFSECFELPLPGGFAGLNGLRKLTLSWVDLQHLRQLPSSLSRLSLQNCRSSSNSPDLSNLHGLLELELNHCQMEEVHGIHHLEALRVLKVTYCSVQTLDGLEKLRHLRILTVSHCTSLVRLPHLSSLSELQEKDVEFWNR